MSETVPVEFHCVAEACPGLLSRVLEPLAKRDLVPDQVRAHREGQNTMRVVMTVLRMPAEMVHLVEGNLGQIFGMQRLETLLLAQRRAA
ncbi:hypothetical protein [Rhodovarius lipocyclicus]|uniref:hypothetical protein n=1 Tax=Rhodovarius lipocyclicus TaxID=268410 RepID=UPI00135CF533|nr:hypothetical protein [Rhodovarius lipocyclicus]